MLLQPRARGRSGPIVELPDENVRPVRGDAQPSAADRLLMRSAESDDGRVGSPCLLAARERVPATWRLAPRSTPPEPALGDHLIHHRRDRVDRAPELCELAIAPSHPTLPRLAPLRFSPFFQVHNAHRRHPPQPPP